LALVLSAGAACSTGGGHRPNTEWHLDPAVPTPTANARSIHVVVAVTECASGRAQDQLIRGYSVSYGRGQIAIRFDAVPLKGFQTCPRPSPLWARRTVTFTGPISARRLVDTGQPGRSEERFPSDPCAVLNPDSDPGCPARQGVGLTTMTTGSTAR
jgi:hypothetical protein